MLSAAGNNAAALLASLRLMMLSGDWIPVSLPDRIRGPAPRLPALQPRRRHRSLHLVDLPPDRARRSALGQHPLRQAAAQPDLPRPQRRSRSLPHPHHRQAVHRRRRPGLGLLERSRTDQLPLRPPSRAPANGSTTPATWAATAPTARSSSSAAKTTRSNCAASASNSAKSKPPSPNTPGPNRRRTHSVTPRRSTIVAYVVPERPDPIDLVTSIRGSRRAMAYPTTWCPRIRAARRAAAERNGKLDRNALPRPDDVRRRAADPRPRTHEEIQLCNTRGGAVLDSNASGLATTSSSWAATVSAPFVWPIGRGNKACNCLPAISSCTPSSANWLAACTTSRDRTAVRDLSPSSTRSGDIDHLRATV